MKRELEVGDVVRLKPYRIAKWWAPEEDANLFIITGVDVEYQSVSLARIPDGGGPRRDYNRNHTASSCHQTWVEKDEFLTAVYRAKHAKPNRKR